jgi:TetR/AcrR family transcriptional repressor of nem operon
MGRTSTAKARLIATAMELMYVRGYTAVGVHEICTQAGVHKGSFYHFFPSKQALVLAVIDTYGQHIRSLWEDVMRADGSLRERLQRVFVHTSSAHSQLLTGSGQLYGVRWATWPLSSGVRIPSCGRSCTTCLPRGRG